MPDSIHPKNRGNVLLVDDDKFLLDMYAMKFAKEGFTAHGCLSVNEAIEMLRGGFEADAVVFDLIMPERDGFALLEAIRDEKLVPHAALIALTNQMEDSERARAHSLGARAFVVKASKIPSEVVNIIAEEIGKNSKA